MAEVAQQPAAHAADGERLWREASFGGMALLQATYRYQRFAVHANDTWVIAANLRGSAACFGGCAEPVRPGELVVIAPGERHGGHRLGDEPWVYRAIYPRAKVLEELAASIAGRPVPAPSFAERAFRDRDLTRRFLAAHAHLAGRHDRLEAESRMLECLALLLIRHARRGPRPAPPGAEPVAVARAIEFIGDQLTRPLDLSAIAAAAGLSRFHFLRVFRRSTGLTPHAWLMEQRVERAKRLLRHGVPIADAALSAGFADQSHLSRRFKRQVGVTPGEFARGVRR